jgi:hypothetical protein
MYILLSRCTFSVSKRDIIETLATFEVDFVLDATGKNAEVLIAVTTNSGPFCIFHKQGKNPMKCLISLKLFCGLYYYRLSGA